MKCPKFEDKVEEYEEWKELVIDWMETDGKKLEFPRLTEEEGVRGREKNGERIVEIRERF